MFISVMVVFAVYALIFVLFEDIDRLFLEPIEEITPWHILAFSLVVMGGLALLLHRYARHMDERISREQAEKENRMRRELTQNIAHELKTPVSSILGYVDTILENPNIDPETRHQFVVRTKAQAERLTSLLQDISTLNRMDYAQDQLVREPVDITQIVKDIVQETRLAASEKQMTVHNRLPDGITAVGNYSLLYSISAILWTMPSTMPVGALISRFWQWRRMTVGISSSRIMDRAFQPSICRASSNASTASTRGVAACWAGQVWGCRLSRMPCNCMAGPSASTMWMVEVCASNSL